MKKAFTLVELIVVITILAILGTIGFISLQGYSRDARNSVRIADINNMKKGLELYMLKTNKYAPPTTPPLNEVTYSGELVWRQGVFGDTVVSKLGNISKPPLDPLTQTPYAYSVLNTQLEYEIGGIMEGNVAKLGTETNAAGTVSAISFVKGNYNGQVAKVQKGNTTIVLAVPTIINSDVGEDDLETIIQNQSLAYNGTTKVAGSYSGTTIKIEGNGEEIIKEENLVVFSGDISTIDPTTVVDNLQKAYSGTAIANNTNIIKLLNTTDKSSLGGTIINNNLGGDVVIVSNNNGSGNGGVNFEYSETTDINSSNKTQIHGSKIMNSGEIIQTGDKKYVYTYIRSSYNYIRKITLDSDDNLVFSNAVGSINGGSDILSSDLSKSALDYGVYSYYNVGSKRIYLGRAIDNGSNIARSHNSYVSSTTYTSNPVVYDNGNYLIMHDNKYFRLFKANTSKYTEVSKISESGTPYIGDKFINIGGDEFIYLNQDKIYYITIDPVANTITRNYILDIDRSYKFGIELVGDNQFTVAYYDLNHPRSVKQILYTLDKTGKTISEEFVLQYVDPDGGSNISSQNATLLKTSNNNYLFVVGNYIFETLIDNNVITTKFIYENKGVPWYPIEGGLRSLGGGKYFFAYSDINGNKSYAEIITLSK